MNTAENFSSQIIKLDSELLISLHGNLDTYSVCELQQQIWDRLTHDIAKVTFDCDWVQYVDSTFMQLLASIAIQVETVQVINASRTIRKSLEMTGLDYLLRLD